MKPKIIAYNCLLQKEISILLKDYDVHFFEQGDDTSHPLFFSTLSEAVGIIGAALKVNKELINRTKQLKIVSNISVGYDNLSIPELSKQGILATHTPAVLDNTVADAIFGLLLATARRIPELNSFVNNGLWTNDIGQEKFGVDVHHKVLGIIGMGKIGEAIAQRAHLGFDMEILYHNRNPNKNAEDKYHASLCSLEELLKNSDFVCLMVPATSATENLMGSNEFNLMKKSAIFINGSRGQNVDESALFHALNNKTILAAGLDVLVNEPPGSNNPLIGIPNALILPHIGSATHETEFKMAKLAVENLISGLNGRKPKNLINNEVWNEHLHKL